MIGTEQILPVERKGPETRYKGPVGIFIACGAVEKQGAVDIPDKGRSVAALEERAVPRPEHRVKEVVSSFLCKIFLCQFFKERQILTHFSYRV